MKKSKTIEHLINLTCYLLIFLFTYTGLSKLIDNADFQTAILLSPIIKHQAAIISWAIPVAELLAVGLLLSKKYRQSALFLSLILMIAFTVYISYMLLFVPNLPCSCGGIIKEMSWSNHLIFNMFFIVLILISLFKINMYKNFIAINRMSRTPV